MDSTSNTTDSRRTAKELPSLKDGQTTEGASRYRACMEKVKRGLGLLVVAAIGLLVGFAGVRIESAVDGPFAIAMMLVVLASGLAFWGGLVGGLALLAWGLLRD